MPRVPSKRRSQKPYSLTPESLVRDLRRDLRQQADQLRAEHDRLNQEASRRLKAEHDATEAVRNAEKNRMRAEAAERELADLREEARREADEGTARLDRLISRVKPAEPRAPETPVTVGAEAT